MLVVGFGIVVILVAIGFVVANRKDLKNTSLQSVVVKNSKYGFEFSYPKNRGMNNIDEWDNGLPGSKDGGVYGYSAEGNAMGPFTDSISMSIYNTSLKKYLSRKNVHEFGWQVEDVYTFGKNGKKFTNAQSISDSEVGGIIFCVLLFEHNNLLYIIDCDIEQFQFYN